MVDAHVQARLGAVHALPSVRVGVDADRKLHQGASVRLIGAPTMARTMLAGMLLMALAFWMYSVAVSLKRVRSLIARREGGRVLAPPPRLETAR